MTTPKILLLDIESAPHLAHVWGLWQQNVGLPQLIDSGYVLCWSAKWLGEKEVFFSSIYKDEPTWMLQKIHDLLDQADAVVHYNGTKFDIPTLNKEFILYGMKPPAPYKQIDLLRTARQQFKFPSNKLDHIASALGFGGKKKHRGHDLWIGCMNYDADSWREMEEYNKHDVVLLEKVYEKLKPWIKGHVNYSLFTINSSILCPKCGSVHNQKRGNYRTNSRTYQRYQCQECGSWFRKNNSEPQQQQQTNRVVECN